jgi:hypothetical protein
VTTVSGVARRLAVGDGATDRQADVVVVGSGAAGMSPRCAQPMPGCGCCW